MPADPTLLHATRSSEKSPRDSSAPWTLFPHLGSSPRCLRRTNFFIFAGCSQPLTEHQKPPQKRYDEYQRASSGVDSPFLPRCFFEGFRCSLCDCNHPANIGKFVRFKYLGPETVRKRCPRDEIRNFVWRISRATSE